MADTQLLSRLRGVGVALVTPLHADGSVDFAALEKLLRHLTEGGVSYWVVQGTTGDSFAAVCLTGDLGDGDGVRVQVYHWKDRPIRIKAYVKALVWGR